MFTIRLHNLIFFSFHGVHPEEQVLGNQFEVNVSIAFENAQPVASLDETINYAAVYEIIKQRMHIPTPLLETLAQDLSKQIYSIDQRIKNISVTVMKKNPPIQNMQGSVSVTHNKDY